MKSVSVPPIAKPWVKAFESAEKAVEAMRWLVKNNKVLLDRNKRLREEIKRLTSRPRAHALNNSSA
ncbi:MAG TPA: hypothetical protein VKH64_09800 [Candidatus Binatia bacterium]|nr:hypothetical protein [Candidatus Binatia bacterium]